MKSTLFAVVGVFAAWATAGDIAAQAILGDTEMDVTDCRLPASGVVPPAVTRKLVQVNGVDREWSLPCGQGLLIGGDITDESVQHSGFSDHSLRITKPKICDPSVRQYSGYMDITSGKHLFFW